MPSASDTPVARSEIVLAAIIGAHGVTGEVRLKLFGDDVETLKAQKSFNDGALTPTKIRSDNKGGAIARFAEVADRTAAEALRGTVLTVSRSALPPLDEDEFYHADLIGLPVVTEGGEPIGMTTNIMNYGATDIVEIAPDDGTPFLVPLIPAAVLDWNSERLVLARAFLP
ncbi:ribosome maturation factor RimM [Alteriqipengyuania lutimaris]|uniref:Ribosome maturation factor RimM n=1 Tax=Alteriqipengyuania lutimaris TaxID=1538146 RepID=A0A395LGB3_9SPHN|nr:ribosome maturation factor RimM [Alteriqipengyuania lutimaris]MBB3035182.1 16S rRNA processing protein RimM [Alteriqipengyuania lutimaris]RDS75793.1 16S rRNA processing protein RimM [Alteriqipengyuania lutimaris]